MSDLKRPSPQHCVHENLLYAFELRQHDFNMQQLELNLTSMYRHRASILMQTCWRLYEAKLNQEQCRESQYQMLLKQHLQCRVLQTYSRLAQLSRSAKRDLNISKKTKQALMSARRAKSSVIQADFTAASTSSRATQLRRLAGERQMKVVKKTRKDGRSNKSARIVDVRKQRSPNMTAAKRKEGFFWCFEAGVTPQLAAVIVAVSKGALAMAVSRARTAYSLYMASRTPEQARAAEDRVLELTKLLPRDELLKGLMPPGCVTLKFPEVGDRRSRGHLARLLRVINQAKKSIGVEMYVLTHCELASSLIQQHQLGVKVTVCADYKMRTSQKLHLGELILAGIDVRVKNQTTSWMVHDKNSIIDDKTIISGSANWSEHAMESSGTVHIFNAPGSHIIKSAFSANARNFMHLDLFNVIKYTTCASCAAKLEKFNARRARDQ